jgi:hypothetical protein
MASNRFYLASLRDSVGTNISFHRRDGRGYSTDTDQAHVYTRKEAQRAWNNGRKFDLPLCADRVDALTVMHVDHQGLPIQTVLRDGCRHYVGFDDYSRDGNDVYWFQGHGPKTTDFMKAVIFEAPGLYCGLIWLPFDVAEALKRRTFSRGKINRRTMTQGAGLVTPALIKRERRRKDSGKTRFNCPDCGRIAWQLNPYIFEGCRNLAC